MEINVDTGLADVLAHCGCIVDREFVVRCLISIFKADF